MSKIKSKCKNCKNCKIINVSRTDRNGRKVNYSYCKEQEPIHSICNWTPRSNAGYYGSTVKIDKEKLEVNHTDGHYEYFTSFFKNDPTKEIDHINGDVTQNELKNLAEVSKVQNCQNRHDRKNCAFHNVKRNPNNTYTAFKVINGKYTRIATCNTDIEAYDKFVKWCRNHLVPIYSNTWSFQVYDSVKSQIPYITGGVYGNM